MGYGVDDVSDEAQMLSMDNSIECPELHNHERHGTHVDL